MPIDISRAKDDELDAEIANHNASALRIAGPHPLEELRAFYKAVAATGATVRGFDPTDREYFDGKVLVTGHLEDGRRRNVETRVATIHDLGGARAAQEVLLRFGRKIHAARPDRTFWWRDGKLSESFGHGPSMDAALTMAERGEEGFRVRFTDGRIEVDVYIYAMGSDIERHRPEMERELGNMLTREMERGLRSI